MKFNDLKTPSTLDTEGAWHHYANDVHLLVRRTGNKQFDEAVQKYSRPHRKQLRKGDELSDDVMVDINKRALSEACLLDWQGITDDNGNAVSYTPKKGYEAMKENHRFYRDVMELAQLEEVQDAALDEESEGNSERP